MDLSWSELLIVGIVALIVIGPKDLPGMFRELGRFTAKVRSMGREFSRAMEQAAKESGVKDVAEDLRKVTNPKAMGLDAVRSAADKFEKWDPMKPATAAAAKPAAAPVTPPPMPAAAVAAAPATVAAAAGPATAALAESVAVKRAAAAEVSAKLRASKAAPAAEPAPQGAVAEAPPAKPRGRVRKKPDAGTGDAT
jgi:sec-independent protein translocase protein TatB